VINISLVGPPNGLLARAIAAMQARGHVIVAAVGNDGPTAQPLYPAAYPGVVGVSAVNARERVLPEAGRGPQVDFVAPGADMVAAAPAGRWSKVRGTSFAAPLVARIAAGMMSQPGAAAAAATLAQLTREALLPPGARADAYGHGLVGITLPLARAPSPH
jgi:subtilisin family serine protease